PPPDPPPIKLPDGSQVLDNVVPAPDMETGSLGKDNVIDIVSGVGGVVGLIADIAGGVLLATLMDFLGLVAALVQAILWFGSDTCGEARFNNFVQGYWLAIQDMVNQFKDSALDTKPYGEWPAVVKPLPHIDNKVKDEDLWL